MKNLTRFIVRQITSTGSSIVLSFPIFANLSYSVRFVAFAVNILIICFSQFDLFNWGFDKYAASMQKYSSNNRCSTFCCTFKLDSWAASKHGKLTRKKHHWWDCWESISCSDGESAGKEARQSAGWRREEIENSVPIFHHRINIYEIKFLILWPVWPLMGVLCDVALVMRDHVGACFILWLNIYDFDVDRVQDQFK